MFYISAMLTIHGLSILFFNIIKMKILLDFFENISYKLFRTLMLGIEMGKLPLSRESCWKKESIELDKMEAHTMKIKKKELLLSLTVAFIELGSGYCSNTWGDISSHYTVQVLLGY